MNLKRGILISTMWALCYRLDKQFPNIPARKLKGRMLHAYQSYPLAQKDIIEDLKAKAWSRVEERFEGVVSLPIAIIELYWSFPEVYGPRVRELTEMMADQLVENIDDLGLIHRSTEVSEWYVELIDLVVRERTEKL